MRAGLAEYSDSGRLLTYRSHNFGSRARLRDGVRSILHGLPDLQVLLLEGGGPLAEIWQRAGERRELRLIVVSAEEWRKSLLLKREQRSGTQAKDVADRLARRVIEWSAAARPTSLRHDAAEAILVGLWGVKELGWLDLSLDEILRT